MKVIIISALVSGLIFFILAGYALYLRFLIVKRRKKYYSTKHKQAEIANKFQKNLSINCLNYNTLLIRKPLIHMVISYRMVDPLLKNDILKTKLNSKEVKNDLWPAVLKIRKRIN